MLATSYRTLIPLHLFSCQRILLRAILLVAFVSPLLLHAPTSHAWGIRGGQTAAVQDFEWIRQGQADLIYVTGTNINRVWARFLGTSFSFIEIDSRQQGLQAWAGVIAAPLETPIEFHPIRIHVQYRNGGSETIEQSVRVAHGEFGRQDVILPARLVSLLKADTNEQEYAVLNKLSAQFTPQIDWWPEGFILPQDGPITSYFGTWRFFNGMREPLRHTGIDYPAREGEPIHAVATGIVVFAGELDIRGNYVMIDHGWGIYSGYAHADTLSVRVGDRIEQGDVLGSVGNTGRSTGPHLHFEMAINGIWVHPLVLIPLLNDLSTE